MGKSLRPRQLVACLMLLMGVVAAAAAQDLGTDIAGLNLCLYGDCEARGSYAADPYGMANPGTLPVGLLAYEPRGVFYSGSYFRANAGGVGLHVGSASLTSALDPWVFQVNVVYAEGGGVARSLPGVDLSLRTRLIRLAVGIDLGRSAWHIRGLSVGLLAGLPVTNSDLRLSAQGVTFVDSRDDHEIGLTPGIHYRAGAHDWFNVGAFVDAERTQETTRLVDFSTMQTAEERAKSNAWFARAGISLLPFVPLGVAEGSSSGRELLSELRLGADLEYRNITVPNAPTRTDEKGFFGIDARLLPDAWNPAARYVRFYVIGGVDTGAGWGVGAGLYGNGPLQIFSCNPAYSSRSLAKSLGDRVDIWAATCAVAVPF